MKRKTESSKKLYAFQLIISIVGIILTPILVYLNCAKIEVGINVGFIGNLILLITIEVWLLFDLRLYYLKYKKC